MTQVLTIGYKGNQARIFCNLSAKFVIIVLDMWNVIFVLPKMINRVSNIERERFFR